MTGLPNGWANVAVRDVVEDYDTIDPQRMPHQRFAYVDIGAIDNSVQKITDPKEFVGKDAPSRARRVIRTGDVLFSTVRTYLKNVAQVPPELDGQLTSTGICVLRANAATDPSYLFRWACSTDFINEISQAQDGTMYPAVRDEDVLAGPIPLPPLPEQRLIVRKLDTLSARSNSARTHLTAIEKLVERYKSAVLATLTLSAEEANPRWKQVTLEQVRDPKSSIRYGVVQPGMIRDQGVPLIRVCDLMGGRVHWNELRRIAPEIDEAYAKARIQDGDILVSVVGTIGRVALVVGVTERTNIARAVSRIRPNRSLVEPKWLFWRLNAPDAQARFDGDVREVARKTLNISLIKETPFKIPTLDEQRETVRRIETAFAKIDRLAAEAARALKLLGQLDQRILAKAFLGELAPQDPNDEPAEALLARIRAEHGRHQKTGRGRRPRS